MFFSFFFGMLRISLCGFDLWIIGGGPLGGRYAPTVRGALQVAGAEHPPYARPPFAWVANASSVKTRRPRSGR